MKKWFLTTFRWLSKDSLKEFFDPKELVYVATPTAGFYHEFIPKYFPITERTLIISTVLVFIMSFFFNVYRRYTVHERTIAEVLATGYFHNFFDKTVNLFKQKKENNSATTFVLKKGDVRREVTATPDKITVRVLFPESTQALDEAIDRIGQLTMKGTIENGMWFEATPNSDGSITIYECPRTLVAITKYLMDGGKQYSEKQSVKLHRYFNERLLQFWNQDFDNIPKDIFLKYRTCDKPLTK